MTTRNHSGFAGRRTGESAKFREHFGSRTLNGAGVSPDLALVRQFLQTFGSLAAQNAREALACADAAQMNCIREMVVDLDKEKCRFLLRFPDGSGF